jgi:four helix bundle protein
MSDYQSYRELEIFQLAKKLAVEIHHMTMQLPKHELYEEGGQIRRSSKSIAANIVEGFARRNYKNEFLHYIIIAWGECDETIMHLDFLYETGSLKDKGLFEYFIAEYTKLSKKINRFHNSVLKNHRSPK